MYNDSINTTTATTLLHNSTQPRKAMTINLTAYLHYWNMPKTAVMGGGTCNNSQHQEQQPTLPSSLFGSGSNGRIMPLLERFMAQVRVFDWYVIANNMKETVHWCDLLVLLACGWCTIPIAALIYKSLYEKDDTDAVYNDDDSDTDNDAETKQATKKNHTILQQQQQQPLLVQASSSSETSSSSTTLFMPSSSSSSSFRQSHCHVVACKFSQLGRLCTCVYLFDCLVIAWNNKQVVQQQQQEQQENAHVDNDFFWTSSPMAQIVTLIWATMTLSQFVTYILHQFVEQRSNKLLPNNNSVPPFNIATASTPEIQERAMRRLQLGVLQSRLQVANALFHILLAAWTFYFIFEVLESEIIAFMGLSSSSSSSSSSIIALGSAGTMLLGWAAKDWAAMFFAGITLSLSNRVQEGNEITFVESGMSGFIHHIGWMQTTIRGYNEIFTIVPNTQLITQRVRNISRTFKCQVKQDLRICYKDAHKLRAFLPDVLEEIKASCPEVISDGTRPFRAVWVGYGEDHIKIMVDTHFDLRPTGQKYWENKQEVMFAIYRAAEKHDIHFVTTMRWPIVMEQNDNKSSTPPGL
jgi:small-conductance mechanosensitive channel